MQTLEDSSDGSSSLVLDIHVGVWIPFLAPGFGLRPVPPHAFGVNHWMRDLSLCLSLSLPLQ